MSASTYRLLLGKSLLALTLMISSFPLRSIAADPVAKEAANDEAWNVIYLSGQRIGYSHSIVETVQKDGVPVVKTLSTTNMTIKRFGQSLVMKQTMTTEETPSGDLRHFRYEQANPPAATSVTSGIINGDVLKLTQEVNGKSKTTEQPWVASVKSPAYQDRALKDKPLKPGESRSFDCFLPEFVKAGTITLKAYDIEETKLLDNKARRLFRVESAISLLPGIKTQSFQDDQGVTLKTSSNLIGTTIEMFHVSQNEALKEIEGAELDLAVSTLVKVKPILKGHDSKKIVYRVKIEAQNPVNVLPVGGSQSIKGLDDETAELTVISVPIPDSASIVKGDDEFLESSQFIQRDDDRVQKHAARAVGNETNPAKMARLMEAYVSEKLDKKNFSTAMASAAEVARTMEGDCTEHAVLLAAMLRAKGIPSRIVVGLVYADRLIAFGGHMWTEANLDGKWIPLDATLGQGGIGAAHIKLAQSSLTDNGPVASALFAPLMTVIGQMKLEVISVE